MEGYTITRQGNREFAILGTKSYSRRIGAACWNIIESAPPDPEPTLKLSLVRNNQSYGEPFHWLLFVHYENSAIGTIYQVTGDATAMHHDFTSNIDLLNSELFHDIYHLATISQSEADVVKCYVQEESPPSAATRAHVRENCQGWSLRVVGKLVAVGMVSQTWLNYMQNMMEPV